MSCGGPHSIDCQQILSRIYFFLDHELPDADEQSIHQHLQECAPCLGEVDIERVVKTLVARSCWEQAPVELRQRVVFSIRQVQLELGPSGGLELD